MRTDVTEAKKALLKIKMFIMFMISVLIISLQMSRSVTA